MSKRVCTRSVALLILGDPEVVSPRVREQPPRVEAQHIAMLRTVLRCTMVLYLYVMCFCVSRWQHNNRKTM